MRNALILMTAVTVPCSLSFAKAKPLYITLWSEWQGSAVCIAKKRGDVNNGNPIHLWGCAGSKPNLQWLYDTTSRKIKLASNPNKCIAKKYGHARAGNPIHLWDCTGSAANLMWNFNRSTGRFHLWGAPHMCLAKKYYHSAQGNPIVLAPCSGHDMDLKWSYPHYEYIRMDKEFQYSSTGSTFYVGCPTTVRGGPTTANRARLAGAHSAATYPRIWDTGIVVFSYQRVSVAPPNASGNTYHKKNKWKITCEYKYGGSGTMQMSRYVQAKKCVVQGKRARCNG
jgi:hypothetical protein